jgi:hypothetical protein
MTHVEWCAATAWCPTQRAAAVARRVPCSAVTVGDVSAWRRKDLPHLHRRNNAVTAWCQRPEAAAIAPRAASFAGGPVCAIPRRGCAQEIGRSAIIRTAVPGVRTSARAADACRVGRPRPPADLAWCQRPEAAAIARRAQSSATGHVSATRRRRRSNVREVSRSAHIRTAVGGACGSSTEHAEPEQPCFVHFIAHIRHLLELGRKGQVIWIGGVTLCMCARQWTGNCGWCTGTSTTRTSGALQ